MSKSSAGAWTPPPNWPAPEAGWAPPVGWQPDPSWGPAPAGWNFYPHAQKSGSRARKWKIAGGIFGALVVISGISSALGGSDSQAKLSAQSGKDNTPVVASSSPAPNPSEVAASQAAARKAAAEARAAAKAEAKAEAKAKARAYAHRPYNALSARDFLKLVKSPDDYTTKRFVVYGQVAQFDSATGSDLFLADTDSTKKYPSYGYVDYNQNTEMAGSDALFKNVVEGDLFVAKIEVVGSDTYDTQIGGSTTVPKFQVDHISVYGHVAP